MTNAQALAAALLLPLAAHAAPRLRSPWDGKDVRLTDVPYTCPALQHLSPDLTTDRFYSDGKSSVIDPEKWKAYVATSGPYKNLGQQIVDAADAYRATGSLKAAECAIQHAEAAATDGVFTGKMSSNQAYYVQGWVIGAIAIAYAQWPSDRGTNQLGKDLCRAVSRSKDLEVDRAGAIAQLHVSRRTASGLKQRQNDSTV